MSQVKGGEYRIFISPLLHAAATQGKIDPYLSIAFDLESAA